MTSFTNCHLFIHLLLPLCLHFLELTANARAHLNISLGTSLSPDFQSSSWASPSGEFALGFHPLPQTDLFLLAIWFDKIPNKTLVWSANGGDPVQIGSKFELTRAGQLLLTDHDGREVWKRGSGTAAYGAILDTGNFVLASNITSDYIWQSFNEPTDTILPRQVLNKPNAISSRHTETDFSSGRFQLRLQGDGNLVLYPIAVNEQVYGAYWATDTLGSGSQLIFDQSGSIDLWLTNGTRVNITSGGNVSTRDFYQRATLDFDGVFRQYGYPKNPNGNGIWAPSWSLLDSLEPDICMKVFDKGSGVCGFNSYCKIDGTQRASCLCPHGFTYLDPSNQFNGCKTAFVGGNGDPLTEFEMVDMVNIDWPQSDFEFYQFVSENTCREACFGDYFCMVAVFRDGNCWKMRLPLSNGRMDLRVGGKALIKVAVVNSNPTPSSPSSPLGSGKENNQGTVVVILSVVLGSSVFINFLLLAAFLLGIRMGRSKKLRRVQKNSDLLEANLRSFTFKELHKVTNGFKEELGMGASGTVYKGVLPSSDFTEIVAVKKLDKLPKEKHDEFKNEVKAIGRVHHKNLVTLLGFCEEGPNRLLVYEFMTNGSLASFLFGDSNPSWNLRTTLASAIARGILYLHEDCINQIIHCDIKPQNILLDDSFTARISDFGLAKLLKADQTRTITDIRGTKGYVAPEWFKRMPITAKVDVFSFGVVLLEIICCRKSVQVEMEKEEQVILTDWVCDCYKDGRLDMIVENDYEAINDARRLERFVKVAIWCIQEDPSLRPAMKMVTQMLDGTVDVPMPPDPY